MPQAEANVVSQNLLVSTLRKEISWCNKARLRGASTSRAQLPGAGPRAGGCKLQGLRAPAWPGWGVRGLGPGPRGLGARAPKGLGARAACGQFFVVLKSLGRGLAKGWESAE